MNEQAKHSGASQKPAEEEHSTRRDLYDWMQCIVVAIIVCVLLFSFFVRLVDVVGDSMYPTLENGDKIIVSNLFYDPQPGDIIVFRKDEYRDQPLVKRVIAVAGQTVDIDFDRGIVYVDGEPIDEPYIAEPTTEAIDFTGEITVDEGCVFVMGDNRLVSLDSRSSEVGLIDSKYILGKAMVRLFPISEAGSIY